MQWTGYKYDSHGQATLFIGQMEVTLGSNTDIDGKISTLSDIPRGQVPQRAQDKQECILENYSVRADRGAGITFKVVKSFPSAEESDGHDWNIMRLIHQ